MVVRSGGIVVHVTSDASVSAYPHWGAYGVTKAALDHLSRIWAAELEATGVKFLAVDPGEMDTRMHADAMPGADRTSLQSPERVAERIVRLVLRDVSWKSGARVESEQGGRAVIAAAAWPRGRPEDERLLWIDSTRARFVGSRVGALPSILRPGDLLVVNDAATLPASLRGLRDDGTAFEVRLLANEARAGDPSSQWRAVLFGRGDWRQRTEDRPAPPRLAGGERIRLAGGVRACIVSIDARSPRLVRLVFETDAASMWRAIYAEGRPVQYAHVEGPLDLWHVQSSFASRPWAVEPPSAGRPLTFAVLDRLRSGGISLAVVTHAAGLSSTGDPTLDALLPLEERFDLPEATLRAIERTRRVGGRVVAVGTTVVRALEGCAAGHGGTLVAGEGSTDLRLDGRSKLRVVSGLLTGIHERGTSHFELMQGFLATRIDLLDRAMMHAELAGYLQHEFGDSVLILPT